MQNRILGISLALCAVAVGFSLFTGCSTKTPTSAEIAIFHTDTLHLTFNITNKSVQMDSGVINMSSVRNSIASSKIDTGTLVISTITVSVDASDTTSARIVEEDSAILLLAKVYYSDSVTPWTLFMQTQDTGAPVSRLATAFLVNRDLFGVNPGYSNLNNAVSNPATTEIGLMVDLTPLQTPPVTGILKLNVIVTEAAKVKT